VVAGAGRAAAGRLAAGRLSAGREGAAEAGPLTALRRYTAPIAIAPPMSSTKIAIIAVASIQRGGPISTPAQAAAGEQAARTGSIRQR
jgi:hypothetical protein